MASLLHVIFDVFLIAQIGGKIWCIQDSRKYKAFLRYAFEYVPKIKTVLNLLHSKLFCSNRNFISTINQSLLMTCSKYLQRFFPREDPIANSTFYSTWRKTLYLRLSWMYKIFSPIWAIKDPSKITCRRETICMLCSRVSRILTDL